MSVVLVLPGSTPSTTSTTAGASNSLAAGPSSSASTSGASSRRPSERRPSHTAAMSLLAAAGATEIDIHDYRSLPASSSTREREHSGNNSHHSERAILQSLTNVFDTLSVEERERERERERDSSGDDDNSGNEDEGSSGVGGYEGYGDDEEEGEDLSPLNMMVGSGRVRKHLQFSDN